MNIWFTSDTHWWHKNIIQYCKRPFASVEEMNEEMIRRWNERVAPKDTVYHGGDVYLGKKGLEADILKRLNGYKVLIRGNHDRSPKSMLSAGFNEVHEEQVIVVAARGGAYELFLRHIPTRNRAEWRGADYHLCGHVHEAWKRKGNVINIGVDVWDFRPVSLDELLAAPQM